MPTKKNFTEPKISPVSLSMKVDWYVWFRYFDETSGRWVQKRYKAGINEFKTYKERLPEANALRQALKEALQSGWNPLLTEEKKVVKIYSLEQAINFLIEVKSRGAKKKTISTYQHITRLFLKWCREHNLHSKQVKDFTPGMAQQYMDHLTIIKNYAGRTFNDHLIILRTFFNAMVEREWCKSNPFRTVKKRETTVGRNLAFTDEERDMLIREFLIHDRPMFYFTQIMYYCFIRRTEMIRLKFGDFDLKNNTIIIRGDVSKNKTQESVVIPKGLDDLLKEMRIEHYPKDWYVFGRWLFPSDLKFSNENHVSTRHNKFVKKLGIDPQKGLYSWKHTGVCRAYYATNKDIYSVMRQLRHRELNTTMIYLKSLGLIQNEVFRDSMIA